VTASRRRASWLVAGVFVLLLVAFAVGLWGTILRPPAYEVRGDLVERPAANLILVRHEPIGALGMGAMELMAILATPDQLDAAHLQPGDRLRLAVRQQGEEVHLVWIEKLK
jgi:Copper binding periplasmic protein CusF